MDEELLPGPASLDASRTRDLQLIEHYCTGIEQRIASAISPQDAAAIIDTSCRAFNHECESAMLRTQLRQYLDDLLERHWGVQP